MRAVVLPITSAKLVPKPSKGDVFGALWATRNIDLVSKRGAIRLAAPMSEILNSTDDSDLDVPVAFLRTNADGTDKWWALAQDKGISRSDGLMWKAAATIPGGAWAQDAIANSPTDACDNMAVFGFATTDNLFVSRDDDISKLNNGTWTASWWVSTLSQSALAATNPHYIYPFTNKLLVPDGNVVHTVDDSSVVSLNRLTLPKEYQIVWIHDDGTYVYFGTRHKRAGMALVFQWDGEASTYNNYFPIGSEISFAGQVDANKTLHVMNGNGHLLRFTGDGFEEVARLPFDHTRQQRWVRIVNDATLGDVNVAMRPNGMSLVKNRISILIDGVLENSATLTLENMPSGIWEYDPDFGLYHKHSLSLYDGSTLDQYGSSVIAVVGGLKANLNTLVSAAQSEFLAGASMLVDATTAKRAIMIHVHGNVAARGSFTTARLESAGGFGGFWTRLQLAFKRLENSTSQTDKILVKYRTDRIAALVDYKGSSVATGTWASTTSFTINDTIGASLAVGDEVEILTGIGAGALAHISTLVNTSANNYTITIDETITGATGTALVRFQRWKKLSSITDTTTEKKIMTLAKRSRWTQFKVELRGGLSSPEIEELFAEYNTSRK